MVNYDKYITLGFDKESRYVKEYQKEGVEFLLNTNKCVLAYDMGLGKTLCSIIAYLESNVDNKLLIICPASLKYNWLQELSYFYPTGLISEKDISIIEGGKKWVDNKIVIVNYDLISKYHIITLRPGTKRTYDIDSKIWESKFGLIIADEAHNIRNGKSKRGKTFYSLTTKINKVWMLTGTPINALPIQLYQYLRICRHSISKNWIAYIKRYCDAEENEYGWDTSGTSNLDELFFKTRDVILRKKKEDCLELKGKNKIPIYLELPSKKKYEKSVSDYYEEFERKLKEDKKNGKTDSPYYFGMDITNSMIEYTIYKKFVANEKISYTIEHTENLLEEGKKVVIFTCFTDVLNKLHSHFGERSTFIKGSVDKKERQNRINKFQQDPSCDVIILNIVAGGTGYNLTSAYNVIFNDLHYSPDIHEQAEDRCYRLGQKEAVNIFYPLYKDSIDITIYHDILLPKKENMDIIIDGKNVEKRIGTNFFDFIIAKTRSYVNKEEIQVTEIEF